MKVRKNPGALQPPGSGRTPNRWPAARPEFPRGTGMAVFAAPIRPHEHHNAVLCKPLSRGMIPHSTIRNYSRGQIGDRSEVRSRVRTRCVSCGRTVDTCILGIKAGTTCAYGCPHIPGTTYKYLR